MHTQINVRREKPTWSKLCQCLGLLLFSLILAACSQGSDSQQGVISDDKLSAPFPKAITALLVDNTNLMVEVVINGDTDNPLQVENLDVDTTAGTFSGNVPGLPTGTYTLLLVYSIIDPGQGAVEVIRTSEITVDVVANEETPADFSSAGMTHTDTDGDGISNLDELDAGTSISIANYTVGGQIEGLMGNGLVLQNDGSDDLTISEDGTFSFSPAMINGSDYSVTVLTQPDNPNQTCTVSNGSGTVSGAAVSSVAVTCATTSYAVGGTVSGYTGSGLVLQNNGSNDLTINTEGNFTFSSVVSDGSSYSVTVLTQPNNPNQTCTVSNGSDTVSGAVVSSVVVTCSTTSYTVGGTVSGYEGSGLVLQNNDGNDLPINTNGTFTFTTPLTDTSTYAVTVFTQPDSPNQTCTVNNDIGIVSGSTVTNITVACETTSYTIGGTIIGLVGSGLVLQNNGGDNLPISSNGDFTFTAALTDGSDYAVTVQTQPGSPNQTCTVGNDKGTVNSTTIIDVTVTCVTASYTIGGTVTGLIDGELVLQNNGGDNLVINADGDFTFVTALTDGSAYAVTVLTSPAKPTQRCTVENSEGFLEGGDANVTVNCQLLLFISADDGVVGRELFATDGTTAGTFLVKDINANTGASADPRNLVVAGGVTYFVATDGMTGRELWKTDGTAVGTVMVKDIWPGSEGSNPSDLTAVGSTLYFSANDGAMGVELWKSDGTDAGTVLVKDILPGSGSVSPRGLIAVGSTLYFSAADGTSRKLWKSDGTTVGTVLIEGIWPESSIHVSDLVALGNTLYFAVFNVTNGNSALWKSDGTDAGTMMVKHSSGDSFVAVGSMLYFRTDNEYDGGALWKSDGTAAGTVMVKDFDPGSPFDFISHLMAVDNTLYFGANTSITGYELWKSDGTDAGTVLVKDIQPGSGSAFPEELTAVGNTLYFTAEGVLWKSDGTAVGTVWVKNIQPGSSISYPWFFTAVGNTLYFNADDGVSGRELWKSDGSDAGTVMVKDINPNFEAGSDPVPLNVN